MKTTLIVLAFALVSLVRAAGASDASTLESQFRADIDAFIRAKAPQPIQKEAQAKMVDQMVSDLKRSYPAVLDEGAKADAPTDEALTRVFGDLERVGAGAPRPVLVSFYIELWKNQRLVPQQRVIFERLMRAITDAAEKQKKTG